jgi:RNA polymerase sigma-54 factor
MAQRQRMTVTTTQRLALSNALTASLRVLKADAAGLTLFLEEFAAENPNLVLTRPERGPADWLPRWTSAFAPQSVETAADAAPSLIAHVMADIDRRITRDADRRIALHYVEALEPSGWLGRPLAAIARDAGCTEAQAEQVLALLQQTEPRGLFAQSLSDCLRLQAVEAGVFDPPMAVMLDRLDLLAGGDLAGLAQMAKVTEAEIARRLRIIRGFNPKPGAAFEQGAAPLREPDLIARQVDGAWQVALNRSALPSLDLAGDRPAKGRAAARSLIAMVTERNNTLLLVGQEVLSRQVTALGAGLRATVPMRMAEIAETTGLHESTISRVVAGTAVDTPQGTWWLRHLFSRDMGDGISSVALRDRLAALIARENPARPMSDDALAAALSDGGAQVARRTVAKYRGLLRIPAAHARRVTVRGKARAGE